MAQETVMTTAWANESSVRPSVAHQCQAVRSGQAEHIVFKARTEVGDEIPIDGIVMKPEGIGPFPAIVVLHGAPGISPPNCYQNAQQLIVGWGYVALVIDSYSARYPNRGSWGRHTFWDQALDAYAGRKYLTTLPYVDGRRIGVMGWSLGGGATLAAITEEQSLPVRAGR